MRYTIIVTQDLNTNKYSAKVAELPGYQTSGIGTGEINEEIKNVRKYINYTCLYHDRNSIEKFIYLIIDFFTKIIGFILGNDPDIVFSHSTKDEYFYIYTFNDKRNNNTYTIKRMIVLIFLVVVIYIISCYMDGVCLKQYRLSTLKYSATILSILTTLWAIQSYWRLRYIDEEVMWLH